MASTEDETEIVKQAAPLPAADTAEIYARYRVLRSRGRTITEACREIADSTGLKVDRVYKKIQRLSPTCDIAQVYLKASALKLARKVVNSANVDQAIEVLSRSSLGVIAPKKEGGASGGFFLSVSADSCGAVKVGVSTSHLDPLALPPANPSVMHYTPDQTEDESQLIPEQIGEYDESAEVAAAIQVERSGDQPRRKATGYAVPASEAQYERGVGRFAAVPEAEWPKKTRDALDAARRKITKARQRRQRKPQRPKNWGVQVADDQSEE